MTDQCQVLLTWMTVFTVLQSVRHLTPSLSPALLMPSTAATAPPSLKARMRVHSVQAWCLLWVLSSGHDCHAWPA